MNHKVAILNFGSPDVNCSLPASNCLLICFYPKFRNGINPTHCIYYLAFELGRVF